jgi:hypothetical protein
MIRLAPVSCPPPPPERGCAVRGQAGAKGKMAGRLVEQLAVTLRKRVMPSGHADLRAFG